jgi:hypothetical protein
MDNASLFDVRIRVELQNKQGGGGGRGGDRRGINVIIIVYLLFFNSGAGCFTCGKTYNRFFFFFFMCFPFSFM